MLKTIKYLFTIITIIILTGCNVENGIIASEVELPLDNTLNLYSINTGVHPEKSILDDENNPYRNASISTQTVWYLYEQCPSAKAKFYLWGTMLARIPTGEHQYYTARALHEIYTITGSNTAKEQAKKAYKSLLDHFFDSVTWYEASWLGDDTVYAALLKDLVGQALYDPSDIGLASFYTDPVLALADLSEWGYVYNTETKTLSRRQ